MTNVIGLNNAAIGLLRENRFEEAEGVLSSALKTMVSMMRSTDNQPVSQEVLCAALASVHPVCVDSRQPRYGGEQEEERIADHNTCLLYDKAMEIVPGLVGPYDAGSSLHPSKVRKTMMYLSAIIVFNLGLVSHLKGKRNAALRDTAYNLALPLYGRSAELIRAVADADHETEDMRLLRLALFNNMAHLNFHYYDISQSSICLALLEDVLSRCLVFGEDHELFNTNLIVAGDQERRVAPAA